MLECILLVISSRFLRWSRGKERAPIARRSSEKDRVLDKHTPPAGLAIVHFTSNDQRQRPMDAFAAARERSALTSKRFEARQKQLGQFRRSTLARVRQSERSKSKVRGDRHFEDVWESLPRDEETVIDVAQPVDDARVEESIVVALENVNVECVPEPQPEPVAEPEPNRLQAAPIPEAMPEPIDNALPADDTAEEQMIFAEDEPLPRPEPSPEPQPGLEHKSTAVSVGTSREQVDDDQFDFLMNDVTGHAERFTDNMFINVRILPDHRGSRKWARQKLYSLSCK